MKKSKQLMQLEICEARQIPLTKSQESKLYNLSRGYQGEANFDQLLREKGSKYWRIMPDYWFDVGKLYQADSIIVSTNAVDEIELCVAEVKNYHRQAEYKNNEFLLGGQPHSENIMLRMAERMTCIKNILNENQLVCRLTGAMFFVDQDGGLNSDRRFGFSIFTGKQTEAYVAWKKVITNYDNPKMDRVVEVLESYRSKANFPLIELVPDTFRTMKKGVSCMNCGSYQLRSSYKTIICEECGCIEKKSASICRLAKELQLLFPHHPDMVTTQHVYDLSKYLLDKTNISKTLNANFNRIGNTWKSYYVDGE